MSHNELLWDYKIVTLTDDSTTVYPSRCIIGPMLVTTAFSAHTVDVKDGTTILMTLPASSALHTEFAQLEHTRVLTSLVIDPDNAMTGGVLLVRFLPV